MLDTTLPPDLPPFSDTAAASIRRQLAARRLCDLGLCATGHTEAGRLRQGRSALLTVRIPTPGCECIESVRNRLHVRY